MKLVFAVDAIFPPLTGIGGYALELAMRLPSVGEIDDVRFLAMWSWLVLLLLARHLQTGRWAMVGRFLI